MTLVEGTLYYHRRPYRFAIGVHDASEDEILIFLGKVEKPVFARGENQRFYQFMNCDGQMFFYPLRHYLERDFEPCKNKD